MKLRPALAVAMAVLVGGGLMLAGKSAPEAPCGVHGPTAPQAVRDALLDAWVTQGYDRAEADRTIQRESGWHAGAVNCQGGHAVAAGLMQMIATVLRAVGYQGTVASFAMLSAAQQLPYCTELVRHLPRGQVPGDAGLVIFWPAAIGKPDSFVIAAPDSTGFLARVWQQNPGLRGPDGVITAGSVRRTVLA